MRIEASLTGSSVLWPSIFVDVSTTSTSMSIRGRKRTEFQEWRLRSRAGLVSGRSVVH
jgi:hypothetical protein